MLQKNFVLTISSSSLLSTEQLPLNLKELYGKDFCSFRIVNLMTMHNKTSTLPALPQTTQANN